METLTRKSLEILMDLIEIKIGLLSISDKDDEREMRNLKNARRELLMSLNQAPSKRVKKEIKPYPDNPILIKERKPRSSKLQLDGPHQ
jgi:hypothetical protein